MIPKQFRIHIVLIIAFIFMIVYPMINERPDSEKAEKAMSVAMVFLDLVDAGNYTDSWQSSAAMMKEQVTEKDWVEKLTMARERSGKILDRQEKSSSYSTSAKDSPEGEYISLVFESKFQKATEVSEYVTVMLDDGSWRVAGYFMQ